MLLMYEANKIVKERQTSVICKITAYLRIEQQRTTEWGHDGRYNFGA